VAWGAARSRLCAALQKRYNDVIKAELMKKFGYKNAMQVPRLNKVVLNIGAGEAASDGKKIQQAVNDLTAIAGQKAVQTRAKKAIATFKIRKDLPIGAKVTLRGDQMWFVDRLITTRRACATSVASTPSFDGRGNYAMGMKEHVVFRKSTTTRRNGVGYGHRVQHSAKTDEKPGAARRLQFPLRGWGADLAKTKVKSTTTEARKLVALCRQARRAEG
jgi:large subunit ribosomal protein L5